MGPSESSFLLTAITAAVTPVVLISTCAALLISITNKQMTLGNQIRQLAAEWRDPATADERRRSLHAQLGYLRTRFGYVARGQVWLYAASCCFVFTVLSLTLVRHIGASPQWDRPTLYLFEAGIFLMLGAVTEQFLETRLARGTMEVELTEVLGPATAPVRNVPRNG